MVSGWGQDELSVAVIGCVIFAAIATVSSCPRWQFLCLCSKSSAAVMQNVSLIRKMFSF